jgi:predicted ester cyclase
MSAAGKNAWRMVTAKFPDMRVVAEDILVDGDRVAIRSSIEGTPDSDSGSRPMLMLMEMEMEMEMEIFRVENGRLAEMWGITEGPHPS